MGRSGSKAAVLILCLFLTAGTLGAHATGRIWPWVPVAALLSGCALILIGEFTDLSLRVWLAVLCGLGSSLRVGIYTFPASTIGRDPDKYVAGTLRIIESGDVSSIALIQPIYASFMAFYTTNVTTSLVAGLDGRMVLVAVPVLLGVMFPLTAAVVTRRVAVHESQFASGCAATIASLSPLGVLFGYWPIVQSVAVLIWCGFFLSLLLYLATNNRKYMLSIGATGLALVPAHKTSVFIPLLTVIMAGVVWRLNPGWLIETPDRRVFEDWKWLALLASMGLVLQWGYLSYFLRIFTVGIVAPLFSGGVSVRPSGEVYQAAIPHLNDLMGIILRQSAWMFLLGATILAWGIVWLRRKPLSPPQSLVLGATAAAGTLSVISVVGINVSTPARPQFYIVPIAATLICVGVSRICRQLPYGKSHVSSALAVIAVGLVLSQGVSASVAPDYSETPRQYLTSGEVNGKMFVQDYVFESAIATDFSYSYEQVGLTASDSANLGASGPPEPYIDAGADYGNGTLVSEGYDSILLRTGVDTYRLSGGWYSLTWSPERSLSASTYQKVYSGSGVEYYT